MTSSHTIDATDHSVVIACTRPGCPWRAQVHARRPAWRLYAEHCTRVHDDGPAAHDARKQARAAVRT